MKAYSWFVSVLLIKTALSQAQNSPIDRVPSSESLDSPPVSFEAGPHHRVWQTTNVDEQGVTNARAYTELATGLNYWNSESGQWEESVEEFAIAEDGTAVASRGQHAIRIAADINAPSSVTLMTPDGQRLFSNPMGLAYFDYSTGQNVLLAEVTNCVGKLVAPNQIVFAEAGDTLRMALRYAYTKMGCEQDVIIYENPGSPSQYGLNPNSTFLEMYTEFHNPPEPEKLAAADPTGKLVDETLDFGRMRIGPGRAYFLSEDLESVEVSKTWTKIDGRSFLVESVRYSAVEAMLAKMPAAQVRDNTLRDRKGLVAGLQPRERPAKVAAIERGQMPGTPGLVVDYFTMNTTQTNQVFRGDSTYFISGMVSLTGNSTFESGSIIKFTNSTSAQLYVTYGNTVTWLATPYRPIIFTAMDDDSVGEKISGSTGVPSGYYANPAFSINLSSSFPAPVLSNFRVAHARQALSIYGVGASDSHPVVTHAQLVNCQKGINVSNSKFDARNVLFANVLTNFNSMQYSTSVCQNVTFAAANWLNQNPTSSQLRVTNSLLAGVTNIGTLSGAFNVTNSTPTFVFRTAGAGQFYLADNTYRNLGTTNIDATLLSDLRKMTTYPPLLLTNALASATTLTVQAQRDTDTPDPCFHYWPLDYLASNVPLSASLTLTNGVALGLAGPYALTLQAGASVLSEGTPLNLNRIASYPAVQEQPVNYNGTNGAGFMQLNPSQPNLPGVIMRFRFTDVSLLPGPVGNTRLFYPAGSGGAFGELSFQDCQLRGCYLSIGYLAYSTNLSVFQNNWLDRGTFWLSRYPHLGNPESLWSLSLYNNLLRNSSLNLAYQQDATSNPQWYVRDNLFDQTGQSLTLATNFITCSHNGFISGTANSLGGSNNKTNLTAGYLSGPLGGFYYPSSGGATTLAALLDAGSRSAGSAGLYHFTATANQAKEAGSAVDIGMHYAALSGSSTPLDGDNDGLADYFEDRNGNGSTDAGETDFTVLDTDYDGRNDGQELADGSNPLNPYDVAPVRLGYWRFNSGDWKGDQGQLPLLASNLQNVASFDGNALQITNSTAILKYREIETNGYANINCHLGSIRFLYKPFWTSKNQPGGTGPGDWVQLLELGKYTTDASVGWFSLAIDPTGTNIWFSSQDNAGHSASNVFFPSGLNSFAFTSNQWVMLTLNYWHDGARLWAGTTQVGDLSIPNRPVPPAAARAPGFTIGSSTNGTRQARGLIDEFETMDYTLSTVDRSYAPFNVFSATVSSTPPAIHLEWRSDPILTSVLQRKLLTESTWTSLITNSAWQYLDTNVVVNQRYEYQIGYAGSSARPKYLMSGINLAPVDDRGKIILLVDQTLSAALTNEVNQLKQDLVGDGWTVISTNAPRHIDDYSTSTSFWTNAWNITNVIKPFIVSTYNADPANTKAIFVVGHVSIPYSGFNAEDLHQSPGDNHYGAWPADIYYGDIDGIWTDNTPYPLDKPPVSYLESTNSTGDGRFDQNHVPANSSRAAKVELAVGRIDFAKMDVLYTGGHNETTLLRRYLNKSHQYRLKEIGYAARAFATSNFGFNDPRNDAVYQNALLNGSPMFSCDRGNILEGDIFSGKKSCVLGAHGGFGGIDSISSGAYKSGFFASTNAANEPPIGFYMLKGSWFGDWNLQTNNFLRATLGTTNFGLGSMWFVATQWRLERFALDDTLGDCLVTTANDTSQSANGGLRSLAIMGDPTLRSSVSAPPSGLNATSGGGSVNLSWTPSPETNATYFVYRSANSLAGPFVRLTSNPIMACTYSDTSPPAGQKLYLVRALNLVATGSGSFTNVSTGVFVSCN